MSEGGLNTRSITIPQTNPIIGPNIEYFASIHPIVLSMAEKKPP